MAATVTVLLPNGRRPNVKVTPNTRILQVIEDACTKFGYNPDEYNLKHYRSILDPNVSIRYANLPNKCKLELVKAEKARAESAVHIALQIESGERLQTDFPPSTSLWNLLEHWRSKPDSPIAGQIPDSSPAEEEKTVHPVCIYLRQEIVGEEWLRATTLKSLGLTGGKAVISSFDKAVKPSTDAFVSLLRLLHRAVDLPDPPSTQTPKPARDPPTTQIQSPARQQASTSRDQSIPVRGGGGSHEEPTEERRPDAKPTEGSEPTPGTPAGETVATSDPSHNRQERPASMNNVTGQSEASEPAATEPMEDGEPAQSTQSTNVSSRGSSFEGAGARPKQPTTTERSVTHADIQAAPLSQEMEERANVIGESLAQAILQHRTDQQLAQLKESLGNQMQSQPTFTDFKFPEQPTSSSQSSLAKRRSNKETEPCPRQALVFNLEQGSGESTTATEDIPDSFFEVTMNDVRKMMAEQQLSKPSATEKPLQTKAMRESAELKKAEQYSKVAVRVHFPDRHVLQGFFKPLEPIGALRAFIGTHLEDPQLPFYLYTAPPRSVLKDEAQSLFKAKLFPAAVVYFGTEVAAGHYLRSDLMSEVSSFARASQEVSTAITGSTPVDEAPSGSGVSSGLQSNSASSSGAGTSKASAARLDSQGSTKRQASEAATHSKKIPKWFKMGKR